VSNESLWRELQDREQEEDHLYKQNLAMRELRKAQPKPVDVEKAMKRYNEEIKPVLERRKRALTSKAYRLWLKATGNWKGMEVKDVDLINPTKGLTMIGNSFQEKLAEIQADPEAFRHLMRNSERVSPVKAERKDHVEPRLSEEPRDET
jgi:AAA+ ATPase superfamily predicted ATPase